MTLARILRVLFVLVAVAGVVAWLLPWILYARSTPFPTRLPATVLFFAVVSEKLWSSFVRMPDKVAVKADKDWTVAAVGLAYASVIFTIILHVYARRDGLPSLSAAIAGGLIYLLALVLRLTALRSLGAAWSIQLDRADAAGPIVRAGPYRFIRHPIYLGAMLETVCVALLFQSVWALLAALCLFCPAELARARFEERYLRARFGSAYAEYARDVGGFVPRFRS
ncbi:MAG TPA: isoprenylcysteine carboxylmethyltransferase family protein [Polyangiaceae bacterium]